MARPTTFDRQTSFTQFSSNYPSRQQSGTSLDAEFNAAKVALDETQANLALIQDDDGALARGSVGRAQFDSSITLGFNSPEPWAAATAYEAFLDTVWYTGKFYTATEDHTSTETFDADKWFEVADLSATAAIEDGSITEAKLASSAVTAEKIGALAVTTPKIASASVTNAKLATGAVTREKVDDSAGPDLASLILPAGVMFSYAGSTAPTGYLLCDGSAVSRASYPDLFTAISTTYGVGDGSTTFNIPDCRGRVEAGKDDMGGTSADRLTSPASGGVSDSTVLGSTGGVKDHALTIAQLAAHTHTGTTGNEKTSLSHAHDTTVPGAAAGQADPGIGLNVPGSTATTTTANSPPNHSHDITTNSTGSGTAHNNVQPTIIVNKIIKAH